MGKWDMSESGPWLLQSVGAVRETLWSKLETRWGKESKLALRTTPCQLKKDRAQGGRKEEEQCLATWVQILWVKSVLKLNQDFIFHLWIYKQRKFWIKLNLLSNRSLCVGCLVGFFFFNPRAHFTYNTDTSCSLTRNKKVRKLKPLSGAHKNSRGFFISLSVFGHLRLLSP